MARPVIALLTDFGTRDHYAGTMKGVALGICPDATLVDISHDLPPQDILGAALELAAAYRYFPAGTIFLVVVDPGVGSARFDNSAAGRVDSRGGSLVVWAVVSPSASVAPGGLCAVSASSDPLKSAATGAGAAARLDLARGAPVPVARRA